MRPHTRDRASTKKSQRTVISKRHGSPHDQLSSREGKYDTRSSQKGLNRKASRETFGGVTEEASARLIGLKQA